jgi:hypothetical protein
MMATPTGARSHNARVTYRNERTDSHAHIGVCSVLTSV